MKDVLERIKRMDGIVVFLLVLLAAGFIYRGFLDNYFFSDDFEWLARAVLAQNPSDSAAEICRIEGRDFNPVFMILLTTITWLFGLEPMAFRLVSLFTFSAVTAFFYHILCRHFNVKPVIALSAVSLFGFNVFVSEIMLNLSALVYSLSLLLFLVSVKCCLEGRLCLTVLFISLAFLTKEAIILGLAPLFFYEKAKRNRWIIAGILGAAGLLRLLLQIGSTGSYTSFLSPSNFLHKLYFITLRTLNISPYSLPPIPGTILLTLLAAALLAIIIKKRKEPVGKSILYFFLFWVMFSVFFALLPKLSSRYFFYPSLGCWGIAAVLTHYFYEKNKTFKYILISLAMISVLSNSFLIRHEVEDYKILGDFSYRFIRQQAELIKTEFIKKSPARTGSAEITLYKSNHLGLSEVYRRVKARGNLPKLLPFRRHSIGGVIAPRHLVPIACYPDSIARWHSVKETPYYFSGKVLDDEVY